MLRVFPVFLVHLRNRSEVNVSSVIDFNESNHAVLDDSCLLSEYFCYLNSTGVHKINPT